MKYTLTVVSLLLLGVLATAAQRLEKTNPPALSKPNPGTYTHVVKSGKMLFIAEETVKVHLKHIMEKLDASDRTESVAIAARRGIINL